MSKDCPCWNNGKGCEKRSASPNCHETCREYKEWVSERAEEQKENLRQKAYLDYLHDTITKQRRK